MNEDMNIDKFLDEALSRTDVKGLSTDITKNIMMRIQKNLKRKQEQKRFILFISSIFITMSCLIAGFLLFMVIKAAPSIKISAIDNSVNYLKMLAESFVRYFPSSGMTFIGTIISFGLLISAWFWFDLNKNKTINGSH